MATGSGPEDAPRSAYLHVPFCRHRCGYCNFAVVAGREDLEGDYLRAIAAELARLEAPRPVNTLYFGGGTPTRLSPCALDELLTVAREWFPPLHGSRYVEWTVEANPEDLPAEKLTLLMEHGVTRLSLGAQSFRREKLRVLEREHTAEQIEAVVTGARGSGLQVSVDLIFAAPAETLAEWRTDVERAIALEPDHMSVYGLTYEKGTRFWSRLSSGELREAPDELQRDIFLLAEELLGRSGYEHYEVSNYARPGKRSRHNEAYWLGHEYYAAGPGAARYVAGVRETNHRSTTTYLRRVLAGESSVAEREQLSDEERARERLVFGLRRLEGIDVEEFESATGYAIDALAGEAVQKHVALGLLERESSRLRLTKEGLLVSDALWPEYL